MHTTNTFASHALFSESTEREEMNKAAWDRLYAATDELVWGEDSLPFVAKSLAWLADEGLLPRSAKILDAASGEGRNLPALLAVSSSVTACDASAAALNKLSKRFGNQIETVECDLARMPFQSFGFDLMLACDIMETLPNLVEVLTEMRRVLRPGGVLIANVPDFDDGISGEAMQPLPSGEFLYQGNYFFRFQKESEFVEIMTQCGWNLISSVSETWIEGPHPGYRDGVHSHTSRVIIAQHRID